MLLSLEQLEPDPDREPRNSGVGALLMLPGATRPPRDAARDAARGTVASAARGVI